MILGALLDIAGGYTHSGAESGAAALVSLEESLPDICLVDFDMPGMTGIEFVSQARSLYPNLPCLVVTGTPASHIVASARAAGVGAVLSKADLSPGYINLAITDTIARHNKANDFREGTRNRDAG